MNNLIAYCGLDCEKCNARIATLSNNNSLREETAKLWSELNGIEITAEMINCTGCRTQGAKTVFCCSMCPIRKCASDKGFETCGDCDKLKSCKTMEPVFSSNTEALNNLMSPGTVLLTHEKVGFVKVAQHDGFAIVRKTL